MAIDSLKIDYVFKDQKILENLLRHPSLPFEGASFYQRCEFLGDRVLGLVIAEYLFKTYPDEHEGTLAKKLSNLVKKESVAEVGKRIHLGEAIEIAESEEKDGGRFNISVLGDGCEALIGGIFLDGGIEPAKKFILENWMFLFSEIEKMAELDPKTALQERLQKNGSPLPAYSLVSITGPDHAPFFTMKAKAMGIEETGQGQSKRQAEQQAASKLLQKLLQKGFIK